MSVIFSVKRVHPAGARFVRGVSVVPMLLAALVAGCGGGGGSSAAGVTAECDFTIAATPQALSAAEVERLLAQAADAANQLGGRATIAVTDRVGNVLGVYKMTGAGATVTISSGRGISEGLDGLTGVVPSEAAAIAKAITGAYLSSSGNAFSTRTASYIIQNHFPAGVNNTAGGPLFGVQFSQLPCGDFVQRGVNIVPGPKRSPLGLAADAGGFPIYKNGRVVGGIGVMADGVYGLDLNPQDSDTDLDERIAQSALAGFDAPSCIRANRITAGGVLLAYTESDGKTVSVAASTLANARVGAGSLLAVAGYSTAAVRAGTAFGESASGYVPSSSAQGNFTAEAGYVLVDAAGAERHAPQNSPGNITSQEVTQIIKQALGVANQARAQIRRPVGSAAQVTISVVDTAGTLLGLGRTPDAPVFGTDVSLQKARTAAFFSSNTAANTLANLPNANYAGVAITNSSLAAYLNGSGGAQAFFNNNFIFTDGRAFSARAIGNIARPNYPDGIDANGRGPLSKALSNWSPFNVGFQLDLVYNSLVASLLDPTDTNTNCTTQTRNPVVTTALNNGIQIFPGAVPIYRGAQLVGAIGISGDGVDQDDMIAFLGLYRAGVQLGGSIGNAPTSLRADNLAPSGTNLRYVQCPQAPFNNSNEQNVCDGK